LARHRPVPAGLPGFVAIPEVAVRSSISGEFKRSRTPLRGGGGGFLGPLVDPLPVNGEPGAVDAVPALASPAEVPGARLERRAALLSVLEQGGPSLRAGHLPAPGRDAVVLTGAGGGLASAFSLDGEPARLRDRYGRHRFGNALLLSRRLAEAGVPLTAIHFYAMNNCGGLGTQSPKLTPPPD